MPIIFRLTCVQGHNCFADVYITVTVLVFQSNCNFDQVKF